MGHVIQSLREYSRDRLGRINLGMVLVTWSLSLDRTWVDRRNTSMVRDLESNTCTKEETFDAYENGRSPRRSVLEKFHCNIFDRGSFSVFQSH